MLYATAEWYRLNSGFEIASKDYDAPDSSWHHDDQSAWYIGKSHELLEDVGIPRYSVGKRQFGSNEFASEDAAKAAMEAALQRGEKAHNLTIALNDKNIVHTLETQKAVWARLNKAQTKAQREGQLLEIGEIFRRGNVPTEFGEKVLPARKR